MTSSQFKSKSNELSITCSGGAVQFFIKRDDGNPGSGVILTFEEAMLAARTILRAFPESEIKSWTNNRAEFIDELRDQVEACHVDMGADDLRLILQMMGEW